MTHSLHPSSTRLVRQGGLSLITAIFLVVVLSGLAGVVVNLFISQQTSSAQDVLGVRAYQAARAGIEWGLYQQLRNDSCVASKLVGMPAGTTLSNFSVTVTCSRLADPGPSGITRIGVASIVTAAVATVNVPPADAAAMVAGMRVFGPGIAPATVVASIDGAVVTLSSKALAGAATPVNLNFYSALDQWDLVATACNLPTAGVCAGANNPDYVQRVMRVRF